MTEREWNAGDAFTVDGIQFRVVSGRLGPDDLVIEWFVGGLWRRPTMEVILMLIAFLTQNERAIGQTKSHWRFNGDTYFMDHVREAWKTGRWRLR